MISEEELIEFARGLGCDGVGSRGTNLPVGEGGGMSPAGGEILSEEFLEVEEGRKRLWVLKRGERIFLVVWEGSVPLRVEVRCDERLGKLLRGKYESVQDSRTLGRGGIEVICSGQLSGDEVKDLVRLSWELARG